jgi:hypothetical protein
MDFFGCHIREISVSSSVPSATSVLKFRYLL